MKAGKVNVRMKKMAQDISEIDFRKNGKSFFCMDFKFNEEIAKSYVKKLEENLLAVNGTCSAMFFIHPDGDRITVEIGTRTRDLEYLNVQEPWALDSKYLLRLYIEYPVNEGNQIVRRYLDRLEYKQQFINEMYWAIVREEPGARSELVESILENGDLDSFYERIA